MRSSKEIRAEIDALTTEWHEAIAAERGATFKQQDEGLKLLNDPNSWTIARLCEATEQPYLRVCRQLLMLKIAPVAVVKKVRVYPPDTFDRLMDWLLTESPRYPARTEFNIGAETGAPVDHILDAASVLRIRERIKDGIHYYSVEEAEKIAAHLLSA